MVVLLCTKLTLRTGHYEKIKDMFRKDLELLPPVWANNIEAVMYAKDEPEAEEE